MCGRPYIPETAISEAFCLLLKQLSIPEAAKPWILDGLARADMDRHASQALREKEIMKKIAGIEKLLEQLYLDKLSGEISIDFFRTTKSKWESEANEQRIELAAMSRAETVSIDQTMRLFELASTAHLRFKNADSNQKRELISLMCSNSVWRAGKLEVELNPFFDLMLNAVISELPKEEAGDEEQLVFTKSVDWWR